MEIIIDGHNLLFFASRNNDRFAVERGEPARMALLDLLSRFQKIRGDRILCVFDGGKTGAHLPRHTFGGGLQISYSPIDSDADTEIKSLVSHHVDPRTVRVVTSDNAIKVFVAQFGAEVVSSRDFLTEIEEALTHDALPPDEPVEKYEGPDDLEKDYWLGVFGDIDEDDL